MWGVLYAAQLCLMIDSYANYLCLCRIKAELFHQNSRINNNTNK